MLCREEGIVLRVAAQDSRRCDRLSPEATQHVSYRDPLCVCLVAGSGGTKDDHAASLREDGRRWHMESPVAQAWLMGVINCVRVVHRHWWVS